MTLETAPGSKRQSACRIKTASPRACFTPWAIWQPLPFSAEKTRAPCCREISTVLSWEPPSTTMSRATLFCCWTDAMQPAMSSASFRQGITTVRASTGGKRLMRAPLYFQPYQLSRP